MWPGRFHRAACARLAQAGGPGAVMTTLSSYMAEAAARALPPDVVEQAKHHILDTLRRDDFRVRTAARAGGACASPAG